MQGNTSGALVLPGGSGLLGRLLIDHLGPSGMEIIVLSRGPRPIAGAHVIEWDGATQGAWCSALEGARAVLNLAGRSVDCRYHARNRRAVLRSRIDSTCVLGQAIEACERPPAVWLNAGSATIYRHAEEHPMDEVDGELGSDFSPQVVKAWEAELEAARTPHTRKLALRAAMVLAAPPGGVLEVPARLARSGLVGTLGPGTQLVSWIHAEDFCRAVEFLIENEELTGVFNLSAPNPLPNRELMAAVRSAVGRRLGLPATRWMLEIGAFFLRTDRDGVGAQEPQRRPAAFARGGLPIRMAASARRGGGLAGGGSLIGEGPCCPVARKARSDEDGRTLGAINLSQIVPAPFECGLLGYWIGAAHAGEGYMSAGLALFLRRAFRTLKLHRVEAEVRPDRLGFTFQCRSFHQACLRRRGR